MNRDREQYANEAHLLADFFEPSRDRCLDLFHDLAQVIVDPEHGIMDGPEKVMALRKLLEARDCLVRA